jgi:serpin B
MQLPPRPPDVDRRDLLRLLSLSALALAAAPALTGCGDDGPSPSPAPPGTDGLELVSADVERSPGDPAAVGAVVEALHRSGGALLGAVGAAGSGGAAAGQNLAISPYSIAVALAMTANGAAGETRAQLEAGIGGIAVEQANPGLAALTTHVESLAGTRQKSDGEQAEIELDAANALFGQRGVAWEQPFLEALAADYGAGMRVVDFEGATEEARAAVNAWTAEQTRDRIPAILPPGSVDALTRLALVNTLYLKAPWETPFEESLTEDAGFTLLDGSVVSVPTMHAGPDPLEVAEGPGWQAVRIPYAGRELAMTVVLPDEGRYADVEADLVANGAAAYLEVPLRDAPLSVRVALPRWTFRTEAPLHEALVGLGVEAPFDPRAADFSAMTDDADLYVGGVFHQVFVAVDEEGTEAAAATAVVMQDESAPVVDVDFTVDRPFLFVVHDVEHGTPLFLGRVLDPRG